MLVPRLLVTRLSPHAERLVSCLIENGIYAHAQPLLTVCKTAAYEDAASAMDNSYGFIIAVSGNAVDYTAQALGEYNWPISTYLAVGKGTQKKLQQVTRQEVIVPKQGYDSEGLLRLSSLQDIQGVRILILRGVGGRELLAQTLTERGALVEYYEPYQRIAVVLSGNEMAQQWQQQAINGAIISSVELLQRLNEVVPSRDHSWLKGLTIYAPSERILKHAQLLGWEAVELLPSLLDKQIIDYFNEAK